ncbi:MAG: hypothetical protein AB7L36_04735, partial [Sphingomonadaceae bacterium]
MVSRPTFASLLLVSHILFLHPALALPQVNQSADATAEQTSHTDNQIILNLDAFDTRDMADQSPADAEQPWRFAQNEALPDISGRPVSSGGISREHRPYSF